MMFAKKGYIRTMEAFIAFFITFIFVVFIVMKGINTESGRVEFDVLSSVEQRDDFRDCIYAGNVSCAEELARPFIPLAYDYKISIGSPAPFKGAKDIYTETVFIASNQTGDYRYVYLYYWLLTG
ncbi:hypothetical protein HQ545_01570 [Candidatus Woesearchaeota archaeon]|nr:hypothetical protein [Candidatus Woesearchaeota archaeon]